MRTRVAVASRGLGGLDDVVSEVFGRSPYFALVDIERARVKTAKSIKNMAAGRQHGAGPLICTRLSRLGVNVVIAGNFGPTVSDILKEAGIQSVTATPGTKVDDAVRHYLRTRRQRARKVAK